MNKYNLLVSPLCPACNLVIVTNDHIFKCAYYQPYRQHIFLKFTSLFLEISVPDVFSYKIIQILRLYCEDRLNIKGDASVTIIFHLQNSIRL